MVANLHIRTREEVFFLKKTTGAGMAEVFRILFMGNTRTRVKIVQTVWCMVVPRGKGFFKRGRIREGTVWVQ